MRKSFQSIASLLSIGVLALFLDPNTASAQGVVNNGAKINIASGTFFNIDGGGFTNQTSGQVTNAGTMQVEGAWTNNDALGVFGAAPTASTGGVVQLDGAAQNITGSTPTNFYDLTALGTDHKSLSGVDANVFNVLTLTGRSLKLNTRTLDLESSSTGAVTGTGKIISETGPASGGYGVLRWNIGTNTGNYTVPFGTDAATPADLSFGYNITTAGSPTSNYKTFSTYVTDAYNSFDETSYPNITPGPYPAGAWSDLPLTVNHLTDDYIQAAHRWVVDRFWIIDAANIGEGQGGYAVKPRIEYVFKYDQAEVAAPNHIVESNLIAQRYNHTLDKWGDWLYGVPSVITNAGANTTTIQIAQDASTWTEDMYPVWTLVDNSDPLPIELVRFVGQCGGGKIDLSWTTWTETNNDFFTLERSNNGVDFEVVDVIAGAGNSNQPISYSVTDEQPYGGTSYYRLKDTDTGGKSSYSEVIAISCGTDGNDFNYVNAYDVDQTDIVVEFTAAENEDFTIMLYDASGKRALDFGGVAIDGMNKVKLPAGDLARGVYIINLSNAQRNFSKRVMLH
jgi:hypothetical protein